MGFKAGFFSNFYLVLFIHFFFWLTTFKQSTVKWSGVFHYKVESSDKDLVACRAPSALSKALDQIQKDLYLEAELRPPPVTGWVSYCVLHCNFLKQSSIRSKAEITDQIREGAVTSVAVVTHSPSLASHTAQICARHTHLSPDTSKASLHTQMK